jgi:hypothetical protein
MTVTGYSDRINHALAFAAKHHDRQVRKGTRLPFRTHAANVAIILTRYGQDEETIIAGILHDFVEDSIRERFTREMLEQRLADKFGLAVIDTLLSVVERTQDDDGIELSHDERKDDYLARLGDASDRARWVCAASRCTKAAQSCPNCAALSSRNRCGAASTGARTARSAGIGACTNALPKSGSLAPSCRSSGTS